MNKQEWIAEASSLLMNHSQFDVKVAQEYSESLYEFYVVENTNFPYGPQDAVLEDMSYWDAA